MSPNPSQDQDRRSRVNRVEVGFRAGDTETPSGHVLRSSTDAGAGDALRVRLGDGTLDVTVSA